MPNAVVQVAPGPIEAFIGLTIEVAPASVRAASRCYRTGDDRIVIAGVELEITGGGP